MGCAGIRRHVDKLDGYTFDIPESWIPVSVRPDHVALMCPTYDEHSARSIAAVPGTPAVLRLLVRLAAADLGQRRVLPEPVQRRGESVREYFVAELVQGNGSHLDAACTAAASVSGHQQGTIWTRVAILDGEPVLERIVPGCICAETDEFSVCERPSLRTSQRWAAQKRRRTGC